MTATIKTNNQPRDLLSVWDFDIHDQFQIRKDFDWLEDLENDSCFFKYRGTIHHLRDFLRCNADAFDDWHGVSADTYFSGTLIKVLDDGQIIVGSYCS